MMAAISETSRGILVVSIIQEKPLGFTNDFHHAFSASSNTLIFGNTTRLLMGLSNSFIKQG